MAPVPRSTSWLTFFSLSVLGLAASAQTSQRASQPKIHPHMTRLLDELGLAKGWVFFEDKALPDALAVKEAFEQAELNLGDRQRERRELRRQRAGLVDWYDVPVAPSYVECVAGTGAELVVASSWLNAVSVRGTEEQFAAIAELGCVDRIEPVRRGVRTDQLGQNVLPSCGAQNLGGFYGLAEAQLQQLNLVALHNRGYTGNGVLIGVLDTGFHRGHEAFNQPGHVVNVVAEHDYVDADGNAGIEAGDPSGQHSHGTYILGCIGAYLPNELVGAAYDADFVLAKTEDTTNEYQQEEDFYVAGMQMIEAQGADVATSSLGYIDWYNQTDLDGLTAVTTMGVNIATDNGLFCLTAAGNSGHDSGTSALIAPADAFDVLTIGAVDAAGVIASFSSDGPTADGRVKPELLGTGVSTWTVCSSTDTDCTTQVSGTSLSTPILAGLVACLVQAHPNFTIDQMRARLFDTGDYWLSNGQTDPDYVHGYGIPDADDAGFDCNRNGVDDGIDIAMGTEQDCNANGWPDSCDISDGISEDVGADGRPDECLHSGLDQAPSSIGTAGPVLAPLIVAPHHPRVGKSLRAVFELGDEDEGSLPVLFVRDSRAEISGAIGLWIGLAGGSGVGEIGLRVPADASLAGSVLELELSFFRPGLGLAPESRSARVLIRP